MRLSPTHRPIPINLLQSQELDWNRFCASPLELTKFCARRPHCCLQACLAVLLSAPAQVFPSGDATDSLPYCIRHSQELPEIAGAQTLGDNVMWQIMHLAPMKDCMTTPDGR